MTNDYESPWDAEQGEDLWIVIPIICEFWSVYVSYRGVRTAFVVRSWAARLWFLILPVLAYGAIIFGGIIILLTSSGLWDVEPSIDDPDMIQRPGVRVSYPGNWFEDTEHEDYDPEHDFSLVSMAADAVTYFMIHDEILDPEELVEDTIRYLPEGMTGMSFQPVDQWGIYEGFGRVGTLNSDGTPYRALFFAATIDDRTFQIIEFCDREVSDTLEPGFDLIRRSFRLLPR
jgi:hypothetical protein